MSSSHETREEREQRRRLEVILQRRQQPQEPPQPPRPHQQLHRNIGNAHQQLQHVSQRTAQVQQRVRFDDVTNIINPDPVLPPSPPLAYRQDATNNHIPTGGLSISDTLYVAPGATVHSLQWSKTETHNYHGRHSSSNLPPRLSKRAILTHVWGLLQSRLFRYIAAIFMVLVLITYAVASVRRNLSAACNGLLHWVVWLSTWLFSTQSEQKPIYNIHKSFSKTAPLVDHLPEVIAVVDWTDSGAAALAGLVSGEEVQEVSMRMTSTVDKLRDMQKGLEMEWQEQVKLQASAALDHLAWLSDLEDEAKTAEGWWMCAVPVLWWRPRCTCRERLVARLSEVTSSVTATTAAWRRGVAEDDSRLHQAPAEVRKVCHLPASLDSLDVAIKRQLLEAKDRVGEVAEGGIREAGGNQVSTLRRGRMLVGDQREGLRMLCHIADGVAEEVKQASKRIRIGIEDMGAINRALLQTQEAVERGEVETLRAIHRTADLVQRFLRILEE